MKNLYSFILRFVTWIHNFSYRLIGILAIRENGGIHPKHRILNYHEFFIKNVSSADSILDIGCGNGACTNAVSRKVSRAIGIDISRKNIVAARNKFSNTNLSYIIGDATIYNFGRKFDVILLSNVLEHIENRIEFLQKISTISPKILIRVPLLTRDWLSVYKKEKGFEYRLDKTHCIEFTEENFKEEVEMAGLKIISAYQKFGELYAILVK